MFRRCRQISLWQNLLSLQNYAAKDDNDPGLQFGISLQHQAGGGWVLYDGDELSLNIADPAREIPFRLHLDSLSEGTWYCGIFWLGARYGIKRVTGDMDESGLIKGQPLKSIDKEKSFRLFAGGPDHDRYRLIACRTPFNDWLVPDQRSLTPDIVPYSAPRSKSGDPAGETPIKPELDWYTRLVSIRVQPGPEDPAIYAREQPPRQ